MFSYYRLLNTMNKDAQNSANERMTSAAARLDEDFAYIRNAYYALTYTPAYRQATRSGSPSSYELVALAAQANLNLRYDPTIYTYSIFFGSSDDVITPNGNYVDKDFFSRYCANDHYDVGFWRKEKLDNFSQRQYQATNCSINNPVFDSSTRELMPVAFKSYWNSNSMVLIFLDIRAISERADLMLAEDFYIFATESGDLLYSSEEVPAITRIPEPSEQLIETSDGCYIAQLQSSYSDFTYVKIMPESAVIGQLKNNISFTFFIIVAAVISGLFIAVFSIWRLIHPVQNIVRLFPGNYQHQDELRYIQANVEQILSQREQYVQQLSQKDTALSGFLLQSQLKNIYVELDTPDQTVSADEKIFFILYLRIHYLNGTLEKINKELSMVTYMFLETLQLMLNRLFDSVLVFQLEPNEFVAKVSLPTSHNDIDERMQQLLQRLNNEREFAFFTVVQSTLLPVDGDFTSAYEQVLDAAQYALVEEYTQLLHLPLNTDNVAGFSLPAEQEQQLRTLIRRGQAEKAQALTRNILEDNLSRGICRIHMYLLCSAIAGIAVSSLSEAGFSGLNSSGVINDLPCCDTQENYIKVMTTFVEQAAQYATHHTQVKDIVIEGLHTFLEKNYQREFSMEELSDTLHLSKSYLSTYYKGKTGNNLSDSIQFFRIQKAIDLLADKNLRIGDVGIMVGISNINTFLRQFKKYTGMTPKEYRIRKLSEK
jgi:YesN/AraC family two-component response regulator